MVGSSTACSFAAAYDRSIGSIIKLCLGKAACFTATFDHGSIRDITESCVRSGACNDLGDRYGL
jgi:hypothetical protein